MEERKVYTKQEIIERAKEVNGFFINTDGIAQDLNGCSMAKYLEALGFRVTKYYDKGANGLVLTEEGITVSTNGHCVLINSDIINKYEIALKKADCFEKLRCHVMQIEATLVSLKNGNKPTVLDECWVNYFIG